LILAYGFENFFSFKEEVVISLRLDANCPESISNGRDFMRILGVSGANGSGKTQVLKALSFLSTFCVSSFNNDPDRSIPFSSFFDNERPSRFFVEFRVKNVEYRYGVVCTDKAVISEVIYRTLKKRTKILERQDGLIVYRIDSLKSLDSIKIRRNASIISTAHQYELSGLEPIYNFFHYFETNVGFAGFSYKHDSINQISEFLYKAKDKSILAFIVKFIKECDTGISDIRIQQGKDQNGQDSYFPIFLHKSGGKLEVVTAFTESSGTKALFQTLASYYMVLKVGGLLVVDEFGMNLHPLILPKFIELFENEEINKNDAQLILATHDTYILDMLGRYRVYLVAKEENESFAYRLDEVPGDLLRNDRPIRPVYMSGRIGGVPRAVESNPELDS